MRTLSSLGWAVLFGAAGCHVLAVLQRSEPAPDWRAWWAGAWAPLEEFSPKGRYWAMAARILTALALLLYVLGRHRALGSQ